MTSVRKSSGAILVVGLALVCAPMTATAGLITVNPGDSLQDAVDAASPGDTIRVMPGDYIETNGGTHVGSAALRITKSIKLIGGKSKLPGVKPRILPDLDNPDQKQGILVEPEFPGDPDVQRVKIQGITVEGFEKNGIWLRHVNKFKIVKNESIDNLENGIWPTLSANGLVKKNVSYGSQDSALWVEASENVRVIGNELHHAPTGLEVTVSKKVIAKKNDIHDNSIGVGLYHPNAAGLPALGGDGDWLIFGNNIHENNEPNSAPPGSQAAELPPGGGILVLGADRTYLKKNTVVDNDFFGISIIDYCIAVAGSDFDCGIIEAVDPSPDDNQVISNIVTGNGMNPSGPFAPFASDILLLGGTNNCFSNNTADLTIPALLPPC